MKLKYRVIERFREKYSIGDMCRVFEVSRSGYYAWRKRQQHAPKDQWLVDFIIECQQKCKCTYGCRRVKRWIARFKGRKVNLKAILRIMRKLDVEEERRRELVTAHAAGTIYSLQTGFISVQQLAEQAISSGQAESILGNRYYLYPHSGQDALYVCSTGFMRTCRTGVANWR